MSNSPDYKYDVFISHSSADSEYCYKLTETLEKNMKKKCFMYERDLFGNLVTEITSNIRLSRRVLLIISKSFLDSKWGMFETIEAIQKSHQENVVAIIPILHEVDPEDCPSYLKHFRYYETKDPQLLSLLKQAIEEDHSVSTLIPAGDVAYGLCWSYYYGYLKIILPGISERCKAWLDKRPPRPIQMLRKLIIVVPTTCYCPNSMMELDPEHFTHIGFLEYRVSRSGNIHRDYKSSIFKVKDPHTSEEFYFIGEFSTPLLSMLEMQQGQIAGLTKQQMFHQRMLFVQKLQEILWHPSNRECHHKASILEYDNDTEEKSEQLAAIMCGHIRRELRTQREMEEIKQEMKKIITLKEPRHD